MTEFKGFPKIPRLFRDMTVTEKVDGTNACVIIEEIADASDAAPDAAIVAFAHRWFSVSAQSRKRIITPEQDNFGFAGWVQANALSLVRDLGPGYHYGEWWGYGIQRGYGMDKGGRKLSLFDTHRWAGAEFTTPNLGMVPIVYEGPFDTKVIESILAEMRKRGSFAKPFYRKPEGIIVYHEAARQSFKVTLDKDADPKSMALVKDAA